jgi:hypothetical protein
MKKNIIELSENITQKQASTNSIYQKVDLGIRASDDETRNIISATFGVIKNNLYAFWASVGFEPNVNAAYQNAMTDPNKVIENNGKTFYMHPGVGSLKAYNESGNPSGGAFTMSTLG